MPPSSGPYFTHLSERDAFEMHAYYNNSTENEVTERMRPYFAGWKQVDSLSAVQLAKRIAGDRIDVLIDLSGHTAGNRLDALARKPAPV
ncbi:MAG: protein O-GlcNAc transferase [Gammaproteobacteria bacterium]